MISPPISCIFLICADEDPIPVQVAVHVVPDLQRQLVELGALDQTSSIHGGGATH